MTNTEVWRLANEMIGLYGEDAAIKAAMRADKLLELGDPEGFRAWKQVAQAIKGLHEPSASEPRN